MMLVLHLAQFKLTTIHEHWNAVMHVEIQIVFFPLQGFAIMRFTSTASADGWRLVKCAHWVCCLTTPSPSSYLYYSNGIFFNMANGISFSHFLSACFLVTEQITANGNSRSMAIKTLRLDWHVWRNRFEEAILSFKCFVFVNAL